MDTEERVKALEEEIRVTKEELQQILLDIRTFQMEAQTPLRVDTKRGRLPARSKAKGVEPDGNQQAA